MDASQFKKLVMPLYRDMYLEALKITTDSNDAQDALQDALVKIWESRNKLYEIDNVRTYLLIITRNTSIDNVRRRRHNISIDNVSNTESDASLSKNIDNRDRVARLMEIVNNLPQLQKLIFTMRDIEGYEYNEITSETGLSYEYVRTLLSRARTSIRKHFNSSI